MAFFTPSNPLALFFALIVVLSMIKYALGKTKYISKNKNHAVPILIIIGLICIIFYQILKLAALVIPMIALIMLFVFMIAAMFFVMGMKEERVFGFLKESGFLKTVVYVLIISAVLFAGSQIWGEQLLEEKAVSITDPLTLKPEQKEINFAPIFTKQAAGFAMLSAVIGMAFWWVRSG